MPPPRSLAESASSRVIAFAGPPHHCSWPLPTPASVHAKGKGADLSKGTVMVDGDLLKEVGRMERWVVGAFVLILLLDVGIGQVLAPFCLFSGSHMPFTTRKQRDNVHGRFL